MSSRAMLIFSAISGFFYVMLGAFGAHVLSKSLGSAEMAWIKTGLEYQAFHTLAILGMAAAMLRRANIWFYWSSAFFSAGYGIVQRQPLLPGAVPPEVMGLYHPDWRHWLPDRVGSDVGWRAASEKKGRSP